MVRGVQVQRKRKQAPPRASGGSSQAMADIVFCIDATASMDPCIKGVIEGLTVFADGLQSAGNVDYRLRLIAYRDRHDPRCGVKWDITNFTKSVDEFKGWLSGLRGKGGGGLEESTLDALYEALHSDWRESPAHKTVVCLTDDDSHPTLHHTTYSGPDNDVYRVIQDFQTLRHAMLFMVAPKFPLYEEIGNSMKDADRKILMRYVPYHENDAKYLGLAEVPWRQLMDLLGKSVSAASVRVSRSK